MTLVGTASSFEARQLLDSILPTVRFAASSYVAGGATILALMLTLLTFTISHDVEYRPAHYQRIRQIAALNSAVIVTSVMMLMFLSFPLGEADAVHWWHQWVYYAVLFGGALTGGAFISIILMLFYAVRELIQVGEDPAQSDLVVTDETASADDTTGSAAPS